MTKKYFTAAFLTVFAAGLLIFMQPSNANAAKIKGCHVWATRDEVGTHGGRQITTFKAGERGVIVKKKNGKFLVKRDEKSKEKFWISNYYVLVNAKDYIPSIKVDMAMARSINLFSMGNELITGVTNRHFYAKNEAWLRYKVLKRLRTAQKRFKEAGYGIILYDAYRPTHVQYEIRDGFRAFLNTKPYSFQQQWFGNLNQSWFIAQSPASHNFGTAVDMSLRKLGSKKALKMPSKMHTLDIRSAYTHWGSKSGKKYDRARYLKSIMEQCGFASLLSEWWHFQVNDITMGNPIDLWL